MERTISVNGAGKVRKSPDLIIVPISISAKTDNYNNTIIMGEKKLNALNAAIESAGFDRKELKTVNLNVMPEYESRRDMNGNYTQVFTGYSYNHEMKLEFDFDTKRLAELFDVLRENESEAVFNVSFSVKDKDAIADELLENAALNARKKAETLCRASGVKLGQLVKIDYSWDEFRVLSRASVNMCLDAMPMPCAPETFDIEPDDVSAEETVKFVWEIE